MLTDACEEVTIERDALLDQVWQQRKEIELLLNEYTEVRAKYRTLCDRLGRDHYLTR